MKESTNCKFEKVMYSNTFRKQPVPAFYQRQRAVKLNFSAEECFKLLDWDDENLTVLQMWLTSGLGDQELKQLMHTPAKFDFVSHHTQSVERPVKLVSRSAKEI